MKRVTLRFYTQTFRSLGDNSLYLTTITLPAGTKIVVGKPLIRAINGRKQLVMQIKNDSKFVIVKDLKEPKTKRRHRIAMRNN